MSTYDPYEQQQLRALRMARPFASISKAVRMYDHAVGVTSPVSKAMQIHDRAMGVTSPVSTVMRMQDRAAGLTSDVALERARGMPPPTVQNNVSGWASRAAVDYNEREMRRIRSLSEPLARHQASRSVSATSVAHLERTSRTFERARESATRMTSHMARRQLLDVHGIADGYGANGRRGVGNYYRLGSMTAGLSETVGLPSMVGAASSLSAAERRNMAAAMAAKRAVDNASVAVADAALFSLSNVVTRSGVRVTSGWSHGSGWALPRLRAAERELVTAASITALDSSTNRQVQRSLATVRGALRDDAATRQAISLLSRFPFEPLSAQGLGMSRDVADIGSRLPTVAGVADLQDVVTRSFQIVDRGTLVVVVFDGLRASLDGSPLRFLASVLDIETAVALMRVESALGQEAVLEGMASAVVDSDFLRALEDGLHCLSKKLSPLNRRRLNGILAELSKERPDWLAVNDSLIQGVESAFRSGADKDGLTIRRRVKGKSTQFLVVNAQQRQLSGIEALFEHLGLDEERVAFLKKLAYGGAGHVFRHGGPGTDDEDEGDYRRQAVALVLALVLWCEAHGDSRPLDALASAVEVRRYFLRRLLRPPAE